ncbi:6-bladed beta-propeller [Gemmatimonadota bacterium]
MKPCQSIVCVLIVPCLLAGCSSPESADHAFSISEVDGVTIAATSGGPKYIDELFEYEELFHLEQDESRDETLLSEAQTARMDEGGYIYVTDSGNDRIAVFNPDGAFSHSMGRDGAGPGEFRDPRLLGILGDTILVTDNTLARTLLFQRDGTFIRSFGYTRINMADNVPIITMHAWPGPDGESVLIQQRMGMTESGQSFEFRASVVSSEREIITHLSAPTTLMPRDYEGFPMMHYFPGLGIGRFLIEEPALEIFNLDGTLIKEIRIEYEPEPVTEADRDLVRRDLQQQMEEELNDARRRNMRRRLDSLSFPNTKSFWYSITLSSDGYLWASVPRNTWNADVNGARQRVLNPEGEYLGVTTFPDIPGFSPRAQVDHGHLIYMYEDEETGAPVIRVFRIHSAIRGFTYP